MIKEVEMKTFNRICIEDYDTIKRGKEYLTSDVNELGCVTVFTSDWIHGVPVEIFAGERVFTW